MLRKPWVISGILALSLESASCVRQRPQVRVFAAPPTRPKPKVPAEVGLSLPDAPEIAADEAAVVPPHLPGISPETLEVPEAPSKRVVRRPPPPVISPRPPVTGPVTPESPAPPRLAQIFTPDQVRENTRVLDESLASVNRILTIVEGKNLTAAQKDTAERIRTFRKQAEQVREQDLPTAVSLARRADLLAKDLLEHLP